MKARKLQQLTSAFGLLITLFLAKASQQYCSGQVLSNSIVRTSSTEVAVRYPSTTKAYFALNSSTNLALGFKIDRLSLGSNGIGEFQASTKTNSRSFFRVQEFLLPLSLDRLAVYDQDADGIDDYYELTHGLNPLNPDDGPANLAVYRSSVPLFAWFDTASSALRVTEGVTYLLIHLSKPYTGILRYQISGTGISGLDLQPLSGTIAVNGASTLLPIQLIDTPQIESSRAVVVSLQEQTNGGPYTIASPTAHRLDLLEGDRGVYSGSMGFTNDILVGAQPLKVALRSGAGNAGIAYFDTTGSTLFTQPFSMNVQFTGNSNQFQFTSPAVGTINSTNLGRMLNWSLLVTRTQFTNGSVNASFEMTIQGLVASGGALISKGVMVLGTSGN